LANLTQFVDKPGTRYLSTNEGEQYLLLHNPDSDVDERSSRWLNLLQDVSGNSLICDGVPHAGNDRDGNPCGQSVRPVTARTKGDNGSAQLHVKGVGKRW
jgi:hypothetical protein